MPTIHFTERIIPDLKAQTRRRRQLVSDSNSKS
jgi:hypothetical protein